MNIRKEISHLAVFIICVLGLAAVIFLTLAVIGKLLSASWYIFWMVITAIVLQIDVLWLEKHFIDGEWV